MGIVNKNHFYDEIVYNFKIMNETIAKGKAKELDLGFVEIFANDLQELETSGFDKAKIHKLNLQLHESATRIYEASNAALNDVHPDAVRPLVGKMQPLQELVESTTQGVVKEGLQKLAPHFRIKRVAGDGHCLFRATACLLLEHIRRAPDEARIEFIQTLTNKVSAFNNESLSKLFSDVQRLFQAEEDVLSKKQHSDLLVAFLRNLASCYNHQSTDETLHAVITSEGGDKESYLREMTDMPKARHGGEPELVALKETLALDIRVLDAMVVGKGQKEASSYLDRPQPNSVYLLHTPIHYQAAFAV